MVRAERDEVVLAALLSFSVNERPFLGDAVIANAAIRVDLCLCRGLGGAVRMVAGHG
jgi:hypothetical protein